MKFIIALIIIFFQIRAFAGRPLITDDSGVIGDDTVQLESWVFVDERSFQHWIVPTLGIGKYLEVSASGVHGTSLEGSEKKRYATSGPIMQAKGALPQSFAIAGGFLPPYGSGSFKTNAWDYFFYLAHTNNFNNSKILLHLNLGFQTKRQESREEVLLWGTALEFKVHPKSYVFVESSNGEVYAFIPGIALQTGFRYDLTSRLQVDGTIGRGVTGDPLLPIWGTLGVRWIL